MSIPEAASPLHNVGGWLGRRAATAPDHPAVVDAEQRLDYRTLHERTGRCAAVLREHGVVPGDRIALLLGNCSAYLETVFAAAQLGAMAVPINARLTAPEVARTLQDCTPTLIVHDAERAPVATAASAELRPSPQRLECPRAYEAALSATKPHFDVEPVSPEAPMILMYTSGSTGVPKGALLPHRKTLFNCLNAQLFFGLRRDDRVLVVLPLFHSFGLAILSLPTLYAGGTVHLAPRFDADAVWPAVEREGITFLGGVPTQLGALLRSLEANPGSDLSTLRFLFGAGAAVPVEQIRAFESQGLVLKQGFGQTETSILCCLDAQDAVRKAGSVGRPVFHADVRVFDPETLGGTSDAWRESDTGETGEIVVRGPITMLGYWNRPEATAETLRGEWLRTGDLAHRDAEGFLTLVGRARDMYISGGENVYPAEVEAVFEEHPDIVEMAVVGVADPRWGESGRAFVVLRDGCPLDAEALRAWGAERLAGFKLPREFRAHDALPRTETGKIQKHRLDRDPRDPTESDPVRG
ncbi:MAG: long-chain fatty acid--CoA ligase [Myxococcota bacterium]